MKNSIIYFFVAFLFIGLSTACEKEGPQGPEGPDGPNGAIGQIGPIGPEGPAGQTGQNGEDGQNGQNGEDGNANIRLTQFTVDLEEFFEDTDHAAWVANASVNGGPGGLEATDLVSAFVYIDIQDSFFDWAPLPFNRYFNDGTSFNHFLFSISDAGTLYLYLRNSNGEQPYNTMTGTLTYRVFVASAEGLAPGTDMYNYYDMIAAYESQ